MKQHKFVVGAVAVLAFIATAAGSASSPVRAQAVTPGKRQKPIQHVVVILKENRSFDEYFGTFPGADGATTATKSDGTVVPLAETPDALPNDIKHSPAMWLTAYDGGKMDGFNLEAGAYSSTGSPLALSQMHQSDIPNYWAYASRYGLADHFFASWKGASFANNLYSLAAQAGYYDPTLNGRTVYYNPYSPSKQTLKYWGCDAPSDTLVPMVDPATQKKTTMFPCFNFPALPNTLSANGVSWKFYNTAGTQSNHDPLDALKPVRYNTSLWSNVVPTSQFTKDAAAGALPAVSWIVGGQVEHPPQSTCMGENQSVGYINSIMKSPDWPSTAIIVVWDEWGGFYDHVVPPQVNGLSYGFRVPFIVISPYTKVGTSSDGGYISSTFYNHTSVLKFIEDNWALPSMTPVDAGANDLMDMFDFSPTAVQKQPLILTQRTCPVLTPTQKALIKSENPD
jgi:phospholipase C